MTTTAADHTLPGVPRTPAWLDRSEFPFTSYYVDVNGNSVHFIDEGEGPPLLMVPGGIWSFIFRDLIDRLRSDFRCIALDFPGVGLSTSSADYRPSIAANHEVLDGFVDRLGLHDITLLVHDAGGPPALGFAARRPDLIRGLVINNTFAWPLSEYPMLPRMLAFVSGPIFGAMNDWFNVLARLTSTSFGVGRHMSPDARRVFRGPWRDRAARRVTLQNLGALRGSDEWMAAVEAATRTVLREKPVLTVFGSRNDPFGWQDRYDSVFPNIRRLRIAGGNHFPFCDDPDAVAAAIRGWWRDLVADAR